MNTYVTYSMTFGFSGYLAFSSHGSFQCGNLYSNTLPSSPTTWGSQTVLLWGHVSRWICCSVFGLRFTQTMYMIWIQKYVYMVFIYIYIFVCWVCWVELCCFQNTNKYTRWPPTSQKTTKTTWMALQDWAIWFQLRSTLDWSVNMDPGVFLYWNFTGLAQEAKKTGKMCGIPSQFPEWHACCFGRDPANETVW